MGQFPETILVFFWPNENNELDFRKHVTTTWIMYEEKIPKQIKKRQSGSH